MIHLVLMLSMLGAEPLPPEPLPLSEQQIAGIRKAMFASQEHDAAVTTKLADVQRKLVDAYADYELDEEQITEIQEDIIRLQRELLMNYHRLQLELRRLTGPKRYGIIKRRVDAYRQSREDSEEPATQEENAPTTTEPPDSKPGR